MKDMPIFFVPVTVGVVQYLDFFYGKGSLMIPLVVISTFLIIVINGVLTSWLVKKEVNAHD